MHHQAEKAAIRPTITLLDVARRAKVSTSTASVVLSGKLSNTRVSDATRERIEAAAMELRWRPNAAARALRSSRLNIIGVSLHSLGSLAVSNPYGNQVLQGIVQAAHNLRYNVTHVHQPWSEESRSLEGFRSDLVDGMIVVAPHADNEVIRDLTDREVPVVAVSVPGELCGVPSVDVDNVRGTRMIMDHLIGLGHTRIGMLLRSNPKQDSLVRRDTFLAVMAEAGFAAPQDYIQGEEFEGMAPYGELTLPPMVSRMGFEFYAPARLLLTLPDRPTAIFGCDDRVARDVLLAAHDLGISVPDELSVIGFDDLPESALLDPPLTTVRQPLVEMGAAATRLLIDTLSGVEVVPKTHWFEPKLVVRGSTGPVKGAAC
jgi:LacI family transcriptional regulator